MKLTVKEAKMLRQIARGDALPTSAKDAEIMQSLLERGAVARISGEIRIAPEGRQAMRRQKLAQEEEQLYAAQHQDRITLPPASEQLAGVSEQAKEGEGRQGTCNRSKKKTGSYKAHAAPVRLNRSESPLAQLALRKRPDGTPYLKPHLVTAGERLRQDFEKGQVGPSLGINWDRLGEVAGSVSKNARNRAEGRILSGAASSARQRFRAAMHVLCRGGAVRRSCRRLLLPQGIGRNRTVKAMACPLGKTDP